jgi:hypothetical protein
MLMGRFCFVVVLALAFVNSACGAIAQQMYGFTETQTRTSTREQKVRVHRPFAARVERVEADGSRTQVEGPSDFVDFEVEETVEVPRSLVPLYVGTALDAAATVGVGAFFLSKRNVDESAAQPLLLTIGSAFIADLGFSIYYGTKEREPELVRYRPTQPKPVTYVATFGEEVTTARIEATFDHEVELDFAAPQTSTTAVAKLVPPAEPGGPKLPAEPPTGPEKKGESFEALTAPAPPPPEETWYGWQTLLLEVLSLSLVGYGANEKDYRMLGIGLGAHALGPGLVHAGNGQLDEAGASVGLHLAPAAGGAAAGAAMVLVFSPFILLFGEGDEIPNLMATFAGYGAAAMFVIGAPVVAILDAAAIAWKPKATETEVRIAPTASWTDDGHPTFGFVGSF